jgi:hypothetical protein
MLTVLGGLAEFERDLIRARTSEGRARAVARGQRMGRPPKLTPHQKRAAAHAIGLDLSANPRLAEAWATLNAIPGGAGVELPKSADHPFGPTWAGLINQPDRAAALQSYRAATVMLLKRSLRNGSASVEHSLNHDVAQAFVHQALAERSTAGVSTVDGGNINAVLR